MPCLSVLRLGPFPIDNECTTRLRTAILQHFPNSEQDNPEITISNRYFSARVLLRAIGKDAGAEQENDAVVAEDGIILVFDALQSNPNLPTSMTASFDAIEAEHDRAVDENNAGDLLRLCVGVGDSKLGLTEKEYEAEYARRVLWCLDRGYEYVEAELTEEGVRRGHEERDKEGFARLIEAIGGTVWSSAVMMQRKKEQKSFLKSPNQSNHDEVNKEEEEDPLNHAYCPPDVTKIGQVSDELQEKIDQERAENARNSLLADVEQSSEVESNYLDKDEDEVNDDIVRRCREEFEQERAMDALEGSLREANRLRELSRSGTLSDEERRARAGDAAMLLMKMMGKAGFDESTSDEEVN